jgi:hypothetical protein
MSDDTTSRAERNVADDVLDEYDFSGGQRGKFHRPGARLSPPVEIDPAVLLRLTSRAAALGLSVSALLSQMLEDSGARAEG